MKEYSVFYCLNCDYTPIVLDTDVENIPAWDAASDTLVKHGDDTQHETRVVMPNKAVYVRAPQSAATAPGTETVQ